MPHKKTTPSQTNEHLLAEQETAQLLDVSIQTLRRWRTKRTGPRPVRIGRFWKYKPSDVQAFIDSGMITALLAGLVDWMELFGVG